MSKPDGRWENKVESYLGNRRKFSVVSHLSSFIRQRGRAIIVAEVVYAK